MNTRIKLLIKSSLFIAIIVLMTTYIVHIPTGINGGCIHLGDVFIYLAAVLLPMKYAIIVAAFGGGLSDFMAGSVIWMIPTMIIKPLLVISFTNKSTKIICKRNIIATMIAIIITYVGYSLANGLMVGNILAGFSISILDIIQGVASGIIFIIIGYALDKINIKNTLY